MLIVYRGLGAFALLAFALTYFGVAYALDWLFVGTDTLAAKPSWQFMAVNLFSGWVTWALGRRLNREPLEVRVYEAAGPRTVFEAHHTFYWVRMEYWGPIFSTAVLALYLTA